MQDTDEMLRVLRSIDRRLALLTGPQELAVRQRLANDVLRTQARIRMFDLIDGRTGSPELAKATGVSDRAAQQLVQDLLGQGLVVRAGGTTGRGFLVAKDDDAILRWFLDASTKDADAANPAREA